MATGRIAIVRNKREDYKKRTRGHREKPGGESHLLQGKRVSMKGPGMSENFHRGEEGERKLYFQGKEGDDRESFRPRSIT